MGILGNEASDVLAKQAAEGVSLEDHDKWMSGGVSDNGRDRGRQEGRRGRTSYRKGDEVAEKGCNELLQAAGGGKVSGLYCIVLYLQLVLNPESYDRARVLEAKKMVGE